MSKREWWHSRQCETRVDRGRRRGWIWSKGEKDNGKEVEESEDNDEEKDPTKGNVQDKKKKINSKEEEEGILQVIKSLRDHLVKLSEE